MGIEFDEVQDPENFGDSSEEFEILESRMEEAPVESNAALSSIQRARRAEALFVQKLALVGKIAHGAANNQLSILALSDGITSHTVSCLGVTRGSEDYMVQYHDPWGPRGSFLQQGNNVAGCAATNVHENGLWAVSAFQLASVLDSAILVGLKDDANEPGGDQSPAEK
ncbi:hypothetical protein [Bradyrhizobium sp. MOS003]|uniref:hypothetical protein n=1 Tax=Bradyrhizobium sp. MOS003 TaxID=2133946 RepID=UPI000D1233EA|nr:hypothetical protein [Bradyrhizobium sp. MOS003]PSO13925.1 hypothetical protein C7G42_34175 [Bradyrhizobium sp. MOS003]